MSRFQFGYPDPIDEKLMILLAQELDLVELKKKKKIHLILKEDILPLFPSLVSKISNKDYLYLRESGIIDTNGNLLDNGKGYLASLVLQSF